MISTEFPALFFISFILMGFNQTVVDAAEAETQIVKTSINKGIIDLSVRLTLPFEWTDERYSSTKEFPVDTPPGVPNPGTTRHQLQWNSDGTFEWFQFDTIQVGTYTVIGNDTIEAQLFGGQEVFGSFDPESKALRFDGLDYLADFSIPDLVVEVSDNLSEWTEVDQLEEVSQDFAAGYALTVRFKRARVGAEYYRVRINGGNTLPVKITNEEPEDFQLDPFALEEVSLEGCLLTADVNYGGGCKDHEFELFMTPSLFSESFPAQANLWLKHNGNGDFCRGLVSDKLEFDITTVIKKYREQRGSDEEFILNVYGYFSDKPKAVKVVRYAP